MTVKERDILTGIACRFTESFISAMKCSSHPDESRIFQQCSTGKKITL